MDHKDIGTVSAAVDVVDDLKTAADQQQLTDDILTINNDNNKDDDDDDDDDDDANDDAQIIATVEPVYDIDFGRIGNFLVKCGINLVLPFINGMMMGFGEIFAHEICFRNHWRYARVSPPERMYRIQMSKNDRKTVQDKSSVLTYT